MSVALGKMFVMGFSSDDLQDLVQLLRGDATARLALSRLVASEEAIAGAEAVNGLTEKIDALAGAQIRTEQRLGTLVQRVDALAEAQIRTEQRLGTLVQRVDALAEAQIRTEQRLGTLVQRVDALAEAQQRTENSLQDLVGQVAAIIGVVEKVGVWQAKTKGKLVEWEYRDKAHAFFAPIARRLHIVKGDELEDLLDKALAEGGASEEETDDIRQSDIILRGRSRDGGEDVLLVVEASWRLDADDVRRAHDRASVLADRIGMPTIAVVAGEEMQEEVPVLAARHEVWVITNGRAASPRVS